MIVQRFIAQSLLLSHFYHLDLNDVKRDVTQPHQGNLYNPQFASNPLTFNLIEKNIKTYNLIRKFKKLDLAKYMAGRMHMWVNRRKEWQYVPAQWLIW